jgi:hypothetical protein
MGELHIVGLSPVFPRPLAEWKWLTAPIRAERIAALRIGVAAVLLWDILTTYLPQAQNFFGRDSLGSPEVFAGQHIWRRWSLLRGVADPTVLRLFLLAWAVTAILLLIGWLPRISAAFAWVMSISFIGINYYVHNSGDNVRSIALFYLMLSPCAAIWTIRAPRAVSKSAEQPVFVAPWALRLLAFQLALIYFVNGVYKLAGPDWREGNVIHAILGNLAWTRFSFDQLPLPYWLTQIMTWTVLFWELTFPLLVMIPWLRGPALWLGVSFHLGTAALLQLGPFPFYMLCLYLPFVPWERYLDVHGRLIRNGNIEHRQ